MTLVDKEESFAEYQGLRYVPVRRLEHTDWAILDTEVKTYRLSRLTKNEAIEYAESLNKNL